MELTTEQQEKLRTMVSLMGRLLVARKDVKALEKKMGTGTGWVPDREDVPRGQDPNSGALIPMRMSDFEQHFFGKRCLGTYLLDVDSMVRFIAFDIDLKSSGEFYTIRDFTDLERVLDGKTDEEADAILDLDRHRGDLEAALHRPDMPAYRWARMVLSERSRTTCLAVERVLGLPTLEVVTGGGMHVLVPFGNLVPAADARQMAREVMDFGHMIPSKGDNFFVPENNPDSGIEIEVFPKQDTNTGFGNLIRLPLGWHLGAQRRTYFMDRAKIVNSWDLPSADALTVMSAVASSLGVRV